MDNIIYVKKEDNHYVLTFKNIKTVCYIGKNGLTKEKKEGDLKTPIGTFKLGLIFGTHDEEEIKKYCNLQYIKINEYLFWIDDINSKYYNQLVDISKVEKEWLSAENLLKNATPYEYAIEIKTNPNNIPGKGSAIFLHCKRKNYTAGCISLPKEILVEILKRIDNNTIIKIDE